jgi:hypothetical protein
MATPNYNYEKRQRELAKKKKKEEKLKERETRKADPADPADHATPSGSADSLAGFGAAPSPHGVATPPPIGHEPKV